MLKRWSQILLTEILLNFKYNHIIKKFEINKVSKSKIFKNFIEIFYFDFLNCQIISINTRLSLSLNIQYF